MNIDFLKRLLLFVVLLLVQVLVLNHIHLFDYATPLLYIYFVISFNRNYPKWAILVWSFLLGLSIDIFANTPGVAASSMTLLGLLQPYVLELFMQRDSDETLQPAIFTMGMPKYVYFSLILSFFNWGQWILCIITSTALSAVLILVVDNLRKKA